MKRLLGACALFWLSAVPLAAQNGPVVVELFTSQGCSSCPPADEMLHKLSQRDDVIALALHVDYWDYIGWKDEFADPRNANRQRAYARVAGRKSVYTPQMIVMGQTDIVGAKPMELADAISSHKDVTQPVRMALNRKGNTLTIEAEALERDLGRMVIQLVRYQAQRETHITRGENAGQTIQYSNVSEGWTILGEWDGAAPLMQTVEVTGTLPVVVLIQAVGEGPIFAAAQIR